MTSSKTIHVIILEDFYSYMIHTTVKLLYSGIVKNRTGLQILENDLTFDFIKFRYYQSTPARIQLCIQGNHLTCWCVHPH